MTMRHTPSPTLRRRRRQTGFSLVEILVSLAIGLVVIGAVFANYLNNSVGAKQTAAFAQVSEDASLALGILRNHLAMADYSQPTGVSATGLQRRLDGQLTLMGCEGGFSDDTKSNANPTTVTCKGGSTTPDALLVRYEADSDTLPTVISDVTKLPAPMDCKGAAIPNASGGSFFIADNRFFINTTSEPPALSCLGNGGANSDTDDLPASQPLVENITEMHLNYGFASLDAATNRPLKLIRYVSADKVSMPPLSTTPTLISDWGRVVSVRICVVVRSAEAVLDKPTPYRNCAGDIIDPPDRRIYRAFTSTVVLNNRVGSAATAASAP